MDFWEALVKKVGIIILTLTVTLILTALGTGATEYEQLQQSETHGLIADFYSLNPDDLSFEEYKGTYYDADLEFDAMEKLLWDRADSNVRVGARWMGQLVVPEDGSYTFTVVANDAVRLWIGDEQLLDSWAQNDGGIELTTEGVQLKQGEVYDFQLDWFEYRWSENLTLYWQNDQSITQPQVVPAEAFYHPTAKMFAGAQLTGIDLSSAKLDTQKGAVGGQITMVGCNLESVTQAEIVTYGRSSLLDRVYPVYTCTPDSLTFQVPDALAPGTYRLQVSANDRITLSDVYFEVTESADQNDRPEHPRPEWNRSQWLNLNGWWDFAFDEKDVGSEQKWYASNDAFPLSIQVPYPCQTLLSGIADADYQGVVWYRRDIELDSSWNGRRVYLCFGAVDWKATVYIDSVEVGHHTGGYSQFEIDITDYVSTDQIHSLAIRVEDYGNRKNDDYPAMVGKQDYYINYSGIWQTVYLEGRQDTYLNYAHADADVENGAVSFQLDVSTEQDQVLTVEYDFTGMCWDGEQDVPNGSSLAGSQMIAVQAGENEVSLEPISIEKPMLWDADTPNLYYGTLVISANGTVLDRVNTYFGLRSVTTQVYEDRSYEYVYVNGKPTFMAGVLDQAPWWESMFTASSEEQIRTEWENMKKCGFNMIRVHMKISEPLAYYWSDKLGLYIWQDMPLTTALNATQEGGEAPGRAEYEYALEKMLERDHNHPSVVAIMLFNEGWGINEADRAGDQYFVAADGMNTVQWRQYLYEKCKEINPGLLVEDMSPKQADRIQPTDLNSFHMYPKGYQDTYSQVKNFVKNAYAGSGFWFQDGFVQEGEPFFCSEFSGYSGGDRQYDISVALKHQIDVLRQYEMLNGFVFSTTADVAEERNGIMTLDRRMKLFDYGQIAYGGDMSIADLLQPNYIGIRQDPAVALIPGDSYNAEIIAMNWSGNSYSEPVLHWRLDATDRYGNAMTTGVSGACHISYAPYEIEQIPMELKLPDETCVGVLTVWIEQDGEKLAKNFVYVLVTGEDTTASADWLGENSVAIRTEPVENEVTGAGSVVCSYDIPEGFDPEQLNGMQLLAEISSVKESYTIKGLDYDTTTQTARGGESASDVTIYVNGIPIQTVHIPDNPRDICGALTILENICGGAAAGDYGYLLDIMIPQAKMESIRQSVIRDKKLTVTYAVEADAEDQNGIRLYSDDTGRYVLQPTVVLNPVTCTAEPDSANYTAQAVLYDGGSLSVRGGAYTIGLAEGYLTLADQQTFVGLGQKHIKAKLFDDHIQVFVDNDPIALLESWDPIPYTSCRVRLTGGTELVITPQTYTAVGFVEKQHRHCVWGSYHSLHTCEPVVWKAWESKSSLPNTDGYYYLVNDVQLNGSWDWNNKDIHLCLNGKTVSGKSGNQTVMLGIANNEDSSIVTSLTLSDCAGGGKIQSAADLPGSVLRIRADPYARVRLYSGILDGTCTSSISNGGALAVYGGSFEMYGGSISGATGQAENTVTNGGAIYVAGNGRVTVHDGTIYGGTGYYRGGALALDSEQAVFIMNGGTISGGQAKFGNIIASVGAVYIYGGSIADDEPDGYTLQTRSNSAIFAIEQCGFPNGIRVLNRTLLQILGNDCYYCYANGIPCSISNAQTVLTGDVQIKPYSVYTCDANGRINGYPGIADALEAQEGTYLQLAADLDGVKLTENAIIDLNGHSLTNMIIPATVTLKGMDSTTDDYDCTDGYGELSGYILGKVESCWRASSEQIGDIKTYVTVTDGEKRSFHRIYVGITCESLNPSVVSVGYRAEYYADHKLLENVTAYGFRIGLEESDKREYIKAGSFASGAALSLRVKNMLVPGQHVLNLIGSTATVYANAVVILEMDGQELTVLGQDHSTSLRGILERINMLSERYSAEQIMAIRTMIDQYAQYMSGWDISAILAGGSE